MNLSQVTSLHRVMSHVSKLGKELRNTSEKKKLKCKQIAHEQNKNRMTTKHLQTR